MIYLIERHLEASTVSWERTNQWFTWLRDDIMKPVQYLESELTNDLPDWETSWSQYSILRANYPMIYLIERRHHEASRVSWERTNQWFTWLRDDIMKPVEYIESELTNDLPDWETPMIYLIERQHLEASTVSWEWTNQWFTWLRDNILKPVEYLESELTNDLPDWETTSWSQYSILRAN